jgi:hypothetical protein
MRATHNTNNTQLCTPPTKSTHCLLLVRLLTVTDTDYKAGTTQVTLLG